MVYTNTARGSDTNITTQPIEQSALSQSRETGDAVPEQSQTEVAGKAKPETKSWAHFVAGG